MERKFKVGDIVKCERGIGFVGWTENNCIGIKEDEGYLGIDLQTNSCGFLAPVKEDECEKSSLKEIIDWYKDMVHKAEVRTRECTSKLKNFEGMQKENKLLKELLKNYFEKEAGRNS